MSIVSPPIRGLLRSPCPSARPRLHARSSSWAPADEQVNAIARQARSEEHTSELQSRENLVCRLLLEIRLPPLSTLFPYTTLFRSIVEKEAFTVPGQIHHGMNVDRLATDQGVAAFPVPKRKAKAPRTFLILGASG